MKLARTLSLTAMVIIMLSIVACDSKSKSPSSSTSPRLAQGEQIFRKNCSACHSVSTGEIMVGPSLAGIATRAAARIAGVESREYLQLSIIKPSEYIVDGFVDQMPTDFGKALSGEELDTLISYLLTLE